MYKSWIHKTGKYTGSILQRNDRHIYMNNLPSQRKNFGSAGKCTKYRQIGTIKVKFC